MNREHGDVKMQQHVDGRTSGTLKRLCAVAIVTAMLPFVSIGVARLMAEDGVNGIGSVPTPCDFATSGGFVLLTADGKKANFGAHGGCKNGAFWGHVNYMDHNVKLHMDSEEITGYFLQTDLTGSDVPNVRNICGRGRTNQGTAVYFRVQLVDNGEPGTADMFGIYMRSVDDSVLPYFVKTRTLNGGKRGGGDVQLHLPNPSTIAPDPVPDPAAELCYGLLDPGNVFPEYSHDAPDSTPVD